MADDLVAFLRARLDEDERVARVAEGEDIWFETNREGVAEHYDRHDPERVLAEVEAKRQLLDMYATPESNPGLPDSYNRLAANRTRGVLAEVFQHLAAPYADHPDYRDEWRP